MIDEVLQFNKQFVDAHGHKPFVTDKFPDKKLAILTCMDTRLTVLLQEASVRKTVASQVPKNRPICDERMHRRQITVAG